MTDTIGKTLQQIIEIQPDLDDLSWREVCYIVARTIGDDVTVEKQHKMNVYRCETFNNRYRTSSWGDFDPTNTLVWPAYHKSGEHCFRILESLFARVYPQSTMVEINPDYADLCDFSCQEYDLKKSVIKAAAKCILAGIELEVEDE